MYKVRDKEREREEKEGEGEGEGGKGEGRRRGKEEEKGVAVMDPGLEEGGFPLHTLPELTHLPLSLKYIADREPVLFAESACSPTPKC